MLALTRIFRESLRMRLDKKSKLVDLKNKIHFVKDGDWLLTSITICN